MGAQTSRVNAHKNKSSHIRTNKYGSRGAEHQPRESRDPTKIDTKSSPSEVRKSTEKNSHEPSDIKKSLLNMSEFENNKDDFYDGIPRHPSTLCQKSRSGSTKQGSEMSSPFSKAGIIGIGKAIEVLDNLGSRATSLNSTSGFVSRVTIKGTELSILAFEVANTIIKGYTLMESVSNKSIQQLKEVVLYSEGLQHLVSNDIDELLQMVAMDKREELKKFSGEVIRFGNRCKDPQWHNLDRYFEKHNRKPPKQLKEEAESARRHLVTSAHYTAELYQELRIMGQLEQDWIDINTDVNQAGEESLATLRVELQKKKKSVKLLKKKSLWSTSMEEVMQELVNLVRFTNQKINNAFGSTYATKETNGVLTDPQRLGPAGLSLHFANIIQQIDSIVNASNSVPSNSREILYHNLPPNIKSSLRSKLQSCHVKEELTVTDIRNEMEKTLHWLSPIAMNTSKAHHGFGWVGEWANTRSGSKWQQPDLNDIIQIETLHHADKKKTEDCILDLLMWLSYLMKQSKVGAKSGARVSPTKTLQRLMS